MCLSREPYLQGRPTNCLSFVLKGGAGCAFSCVLGISAASGKGSARRAVRALDAARPVGGGGKRECQG